MNSWSALLYASLACIILIDILPTLLWYSQTLVIRPPVIRIALLSGHDLTVYIVNFSFISIENLAQNKNKVVQFLFNFLFFSPF